MSAPPPPPGFEDVAPGTHAWAEDEKKDSDAAAPDGADAVADKLAGAAVEDPPEAGLDVPDKASELHDVEEHHITKFIPEGNTPYVSAKSFEELGLSPELLKGLYSEMRFERPSKVQADTLPMILTPPHRNLVAQAKNGSGKTTCFVLGMLSRVDPATPRPQALCICPTRELVVQNVAVLTKMAKYTGIQCTDTASAGVGRIPPIASQVVIGTIGKIKNWIANRTLVVKNMRVVVFDEADEMMAEDGFGDDSVKVLKDIARGGVPYDKLQILLFSATFSDRVRQLAEKLAGPNANRIFIKKEELSLDVIKQFKVDCPSAAEKDQVLLKMIFPATDKLGQCIIFVRSREAARHLHDRMKGAGYTCTSIQGDMQHEDRDRVVQEFREGKTRILIATDVLSRGFDHSNVTLVINYHPPLARDNVRPAFETYMHRIGRSGRFGRKGAAFNLTGDDRERRHVELIAQHFNHPIQGVQWDDEEAFEKVLVDAGLSSGE